MWTLVNNMSNRWASKAVLGVDLPGEDILALKWLHHGVKVRYFDER